MESVETFMKIFLRNWKDSKNDDLLRIFKEAPGYLKNISKSDRERALEIIFNEEKGLFKFITTTCMDRSQINIFRTSLKESFYLLQVIMQLYKQEYEFYITQTKNVCFYCMKTICWIYIRKTAAETLSKLIELFSEHDMALDGFIDYYNRSYLRLYERKDGYVFFIVIGAIAKYSPKIETMALSADSIFTQLLNNLKKEYKISNQKQPDEIKIYFDCLIDMFENFVPFDENSERSVYFQELYSFLLKLCESSKSQKTIKMKAIYLWRKHIDFFSSFTFKDYKMWHTELNLLIKDNENYTVINALRSFYRIIAKELLQVENMEIFLYMKNYFMSNLCNNNLSTKKSRLIVNGLGEFAASFVKYSPAEIYEIFQLITLQTSIFYEIEKIEDNDLEMITDYMHTLSQILCYMQNVSLQQVNTVTELSVQFTKQFPKFKESYKNYAIHALIMTFKNINQLEKKLQREFFNSYIREGILWSCSHTLLIDVELQQEIENLPDKPICYKNYLPLWHSIFNFDDKVQFPRYLIVQIFNEFIIVLLSYLSTLNLNTKTVENNVISGTLCSLKAENETDFRFFINLVDLYGDILEKIEVILLEIWIEKLLIQFIKFSYKYPLISGFYKLIEVIFKKPGIFANIQINFTNASNNIYSSNNTDETNNLIDCNKSIFKIISQYLTDVLKLCPKFSGELQLSCIYLMFNTPLSIIKELIDETVPIFKIVFNIGLTDLSLAFRALDTLEFWTKNSAIKVSRSFLENIIVCTEPYLSSDESSMYIFQDMKKTKQNVRETIPSVDENLKVLQKQILLFYGSLDLSIPFNFIREKSLNTNASWNKKNLLSCELLFPDIRLEIHFDKQIFRIIQLTKSGDRRIKISACELLHTMITVMLGKKIMDICFDKKLCSFVLELSCDSDEAIRSLFHPLVIQLTHFLSSKLMSESRKPQEFLDSLFEGLAEELNSPLRDYCGLYLKEFIQWSIKQSTERDLTNLINVRSIIRRITNLALYPSSKKCLAAAIAFNHVSAILSENLKVLNTYWLEFFYAFVKSMNENSGIQIVTALNYITKIIQNHSNLFNTKYSHRRKPLEFPDETLSGALIWLFNNCSSINSKFRRKCLELFENVLPLSANFIVIKDHLINNFNRVAFKYVEDEFKSMTVKNTEAFLKTLDLYIWIYEKGCLLFESFPIFMISSQTCELFSKYFINFVNIIKNQSISIYSDKLNEVDRIGNLRIEILFRMIDFLKISIEKENNLWRSLWENNLFLLISNCILYPSKVGLTNNMLYIIENLPNQLEDLLSLMIKNLSDEYMIKFRYYIKQESNENYQKFTKIYSIINKNEDVDTLIEFIKGLFILKKTKFCDFEKEYNFTVTFVKSVIDDIFKSLKFKIMGNDSCQIFDENVKEYLDNLMKFLLTDYQPEVIEMLVFFIINNCPLANSTGLIIAQGEYFIDLFKESIFDYMLKNSIETMKICDKSLTDNIDKIFFLIEEILIFGQKNKDKRIEIWSDTIIDRFDTFHRLINNIEYRKIKFININRLAALLKSKPTDIKESEERLNKLYSWILEELMIANDLEKKSVILQNFLSFLVGEELTNKPELLIIFRHLRDDDSIIWLEKLKSNPLIKHQASTCFYILLKMLIITKSLIVYQAIVKYAAGVCELLLKENIKKYLQPYFANVSDYCAIETLRITYKMFMDFHLNEERLDILRYFLLPSIELNKRSIVEEFHRESIEEMIACIIKKIDSDNIADRKTLIISKIGCYSMLELIFSKFDLAFINIKDPMSGNEKALNQVLTQQSVQVRFFSAKNKEEKELTRRLHCAALNCCISIVSLKQEEKFYKFIFFENRKADQLLWERIVDCEKHYSFQQSSSMIRKDRKKLINIRRGNRYNENPTESTSTYFHRYDLTSLTLLENVNAYDLNDINLLSQGKPISIVDQRFHLSFEDDELNSHECMSMITGALIHMFNNEIASLPASPEEIHSDSLPVSLKAFRNAFATQKDNVRMYLMKIIANTKNIFLPYIKTFFTAIGSSIYCYLKNHSLNYVVRDMLVIIIESEYRLSETTECEVGQQLIEQLIEKAPDSQLAIYKYNIEIIENLWKLWNKQLQTPRNLEHKIGSNPELTIRVISIIFRNGGNEAIELANRVTVRQLINQSLQNWKNNESIVLQTFEALGWLLKFNDESYCQVELAKLHSLLSSIQNHNHDRCAQCVCALYKSCHSETKCQQFMKFTNPWNVSDSHKPECFELFLLRIPNIEPASLSVELLRLNLKSVLRERILGSEGPALCIIQCLVPLLTDVELYPYLELVVTFVNSVSLLEHRRIAYNILMASYTRFKTFCTEFLVEGLAEPDEELRVLLLNFWRDHVQLPQTCSDRLLALFQMYRPELRNNFVSFLCLLMLDLTSKSIDNNRSMFSPLTDCKFEDYQILILQRRINLGTMAPLFAPSLTSQLGQIGQYSEMISQPNSFSATMRLLASRDPNDKNSLTIDTRLQDRKLPDPSQNKLSKRLATSTSDPSSIYSEIAIRRSNNYYENHKKETERRRNGAKIYRSYRIGDFPDVEITQATFVECLRQFIMKDWLSCKDLAVTIICNIIDRLKGSDKYQTFIDSISKVFQHILNQPEEKNYFAVVALEVIFYSKEINFNTNSVRKISSTMGCDSLGILLLEEACIPNENVPEEDSEPPPTKRLRFDSHSLKSNWIELASLYKSIGETDIVNTIFNNQALFSDDIREATIAQLESNWAAGKTAYENAYEVAIGGEKEHCLEGIFECLSQLSSWGEINRKIDIILNGDYNSAWEHPKRNQLLPWIFTAQLHKALEDFTGNKELSNKSFLINFDSWIRGKETELRKQYGEEMSVLFACNEKTEEMSRHCLKCSLEHVREQWIHISPFSEKVRLKMIVKLRGIYNIHAYIETLKLSDIENGIENLIQHWDQHLPCSDGDLLSWNMHISYRLAFAHLLHEKITQLSQESSVLDLLIAASARQRMKISELALKNKNNVLAKKHTFITEKLIQALDNLEYSNIKNEFTLIASKYKFISAEVESKPQKKCNYYISSWNIAKSIVNDENVDSSTKINVKYHLFDLTQSLKNLLIINQECLHIMTNNEFISDCLEVEEQDIFVALQTYSFHNLKSICGIGGDTEMAKSYTIFGKYCYSLLCELGNRDSSMSEDFITSILTGMSFGSLEAAHYFPCLLKYEFYKNNDRASELFRSKCQKVPTWLFLSWQTQIMSYLGKPHCQLLFPIVNKLIQEYPNGIIFNFRQTYEALPELKMNPEIRIMYQTLFSDSRIETFFQAMSRVCQPEHYLRYHLIEIFNCDENFCQSIDVLISRVFTQDNELQGPLYKILDNYRSEIEKLKTMDFQAAQNYSHKITMDLYHTMKQRLLDVRKKALQLKDYSPYLTYFSDKDLEIEIPGQYHQNKKPMPQYHIKISKFDRFVTIMESKCNPIKINIIGNDGKSYGFLIKFGEDLRQDQRLQQIFEVSNQTLLKDKICKQKYVSINTYHVVPLSSSLGFIQWVNGTKSLKDFIEFSIIDKNTIRTVAGKYMQWIMKAGHSRQKIHCYKEALMKYNRKDVITQMKNFISNLEWDCLRKTFLMLSPSLECFVSLRHNFIISYAAMCTVHWITGVGDRHLENTLIEVKTGKCYGIDFGLAFGTGIDQTIPELVPFRLTPQILGLLKPFDEQDLFKITMTRVLCSLRNERGPILACLEVMIHEPLEWNKYLNKRLQREEQENLDVKWIPKKKILFVQKKLNGAKPSTVMLEELSCFHDKNDDEDNEYFEKYKHIISGTDSYSASIRSRMRNESLTPEEQVQCLLDQATDLNLLGRMWEGWCSFA